MSLRDYLDEFHQAVAIIDDYGFAELIDIKEEIRPAKQAVINARIVLVDGSSLHVRTYIDAKYKIEIISYAFQYHDNKGELIFRYDNARHKPELGFDEHKHQNDGTIIPTTMPDIAEIVYDVLKYL